MVKENYWAPSHSAGAQHFLEEATCDKERSHSLWLGCNIPRVETGDTLRAFDPGSTAEIKGSGGKCTWKVLGRGTVQP